jgi:hypothetical protein
VNSPQARSQFPIKTSARDKLSLWLKQSFRTTESYRAEKFKGRTTLVLPEWFPSPTEPCLESPRRRMLMDPQSTAVSDFMESRVWSARRLPVEPWR